jgi:hypothetical protein
MQAMTTFGGAVGNSPRGSTLTLGIFVALASAVAAGALVAIEPTALVIAGTVAVLLIAVTSPGARFAIVVAGGLLVFRTSDQLDATKSSYLVWVGISTVLAITGLTAERDGRRLTDVRPLLLAAGGVTGAIALSLIVALAHGNQLIDWVRDAAPYGLLAVSPFLAWDGAHSRLGPHMEAVAVAAGLVASIAFAVEWLGRRGLADLPFATLGSGSISLSALAFVVATAAILSRRPRRLAWVSLAAAVLTLMLITGTRTNLALLVGPAAMLLVRGQGFARVLRLAGATVALALGVLTLTFLAVQSGLIDVTRLTDRLDLLLRLGSDLTADASYVERQIQGAIATSAFAGSPLVGVGLGWRYEWTASYGLSYSTFNIDTGLDLAAKFGVFGVALLAIAAAGATRFYRRLAVRLPEHVRLSTLGFAATVISVLPLMNPFQDKGLPLAVAILAAWALASARPDHVEGVTPAASPRIRTAHMRLQRP